MTDYPRMLKRSMDKSKRDQLLRAMYLVLVFVLTDMSSGNALETTTYTTISDRLNSAYYGGAPAMNFFNRSTLTIVECAKICEEDPECGGFNFCQVTGDTTCETLEASPDPIDPTKVWNRIGCLFYHRSLGGCLNGGVVTVNSTCACPCGYTNTYCEDNVQDCATAYQQGHRKKHVMKTPHGYKVECRLQEGPVTRLLLRGQNEVDHFENKSWRDYKNGFKYPWRDNGWIGLDKIRDILTNSPYNYTTKVTVIFQNDTTEYTGYYGNFFVDSEANSYTLTYSNYSAGQYPLDDGFSGTGQNDSTNGQPFCPLSAGDNCGGCSTEPRHCWWFGSGCSYVNPFALLRELVWPKASVMVPVYKLYLDIIAVIP